MKETHCYGLAVEVGAGLAAINGGKAMHTDIRFTLGGIELLIPFKGQDYIVSISPKGETHEQHRSDSPSLTVA